MGLADLPALWTDGELWKGDLVVRAAISLPRPRNFLFGYGAHDVLLDSIPRREGHAGMGIGSKNGQDKAGPRTLRHQAILPQILGGAQPPFWARRGRTAPTAARAVLTGGYHGHRAR